MKKIFYLVSLAGMMFIMNACTTSGYVSSEPAYVEYSRPARPSDLHIWIDGDWVWSRQTNGYVRSNGYWHKPNRTRTYISGSWRVTPQGHRWDKGHWQKNNR
jgi:hypothetical protein